MATNPKIRAWGDEFAATATAIVARDMPNREELCGLAEQLVVNAASLLMTAAVGLHKPGWIVQVVHAGMEAMIEAVEKRMAAPNN